MYKLTALLFSVLLLGFSLTQAQDARPTLVPIIDISGDEVGTPPQNYQTIKTSTITFDKVYSAGLIWTVNNITDSKTGYDLQSNGSTQQIWYDLTNPGYLHAVFMNSQFADKTWADRTSLYFGSVDNGDTWFELGGVPVYNGTTGRSGYCVIRGTSDGKAVISDHNNADQTATRTTLFIDDSPFGYSFTNYDPGTFTADLIWPRVAVLPNDDMVIASSINSTAAVGFYTNTFSNGVFSGWQLHSGNNAEGYDLATSDGGKVGLAYIGEVVGLDYADILYKESTDGGLTWTSPIKAFDADETQPQFYGGLRGISANFIGEDPCIVFELNIVTTAANYSPDAPSEIRFWSPNVNGGVSKILADSSNVPYYPNVNFTQSGDVLIPVCRPVISRSEINDYLFVAFMSTTGNFWPAADSSVYFAGWFSYSPDGGDTWTAPEKFTPDTPLLDFRHPSIAPVSPVSTTDEDVITVHITMVGDSIPGSTVNANAGMPQLVSAQYYHFTTDIQVVGVGDDITVNSFNLEQNYPNPFNPSTTINYSLAERSAVTLKVYDVLGNEVANLVNTTQEAGSHSINFDASKLSSGLYIYTLNTGNFTSSKKMMLLK